jgi:hypothetical protein
VIGPVVPWPKRFEAETIGDEVGRRFEADGDEAIHCHDRNVRGLPITGIVIASSSYSGVASGVT